MKFHNDADGDALRRLEADGNDLSRPMLVDFFVVVPDERTGRHLAGAVVGAGCRASLERDAETGDYACYCAREMIASYAAIIAAQQELDRLSRPLGGKIDGWGSFGNSETR